MINNCIVEEFSNEKSRLVGEIDKLRNELSDAQSQITITGLRMETDLEEEKRKAQDEIASLQILVRGMFFRFNKNINLININYFRNC